MSRDSTPGAGSRLDQLLREQAEKEAAIATQIVNRSLSDFEARLSAALVSTFGAMARGLDRLQTRQNQGMEDFEAGTKGALDRLQTHLDQAIGQVRRMLILTLLLPAAAAILILAAASWALPKLMWPALEQAALERAGLYIQPDRRGGRWVWTPEGTTIHYPDRPKGPTREMPAAEPMYIRIPGS